MSNPAPTMVVEELESAPALLAMQLHQAAHAVKTIPVIAAGGYMTQNIRGGAGFAGGWVGAILAGS